MTSTFPTAPDNIAPVDVTNGTVARDTHPLLHNELASAVNAIEAALLPGGTMDSAAYLLKAGGTLSGSLLFSPDNTHDIGTSAGSRPRAIYGVTVSAITVETSVLYSPTTLSFRTGATVRWRVGSTGNLDAVSDNVYDVGAAAVNRPRSIFAATSVVSPLLNLTHRTAPASPADGDMWTTTAGLFVRINGTTRSVTVT